MTTVAAFADDLDTIRQQPAIKKSYSFRSLPPDAGKGIIVALIDSGLTRELKDLLGDRVTAVSVRKDESGISDGIGTGTFDLSLIAALAPQAALISIKVLDDEGNAGYEEIRNGIIRATELKANIIVLPLGAPPDEEDNGVNAAIGNALAKGILILASAGNDSGGPISYPSTLKNVVAIGCSNEKDELAYFSSHDKKMLCAPGDKVIGVSLEKNVDMAGRMLIAHSGTSMAAGVAGGIFAVLWSQAPDLTSQQLIDIVTSSAIMISGDWHGGDGEISRHAPVKRIDGQAALLKCVSRGRTSK